MQVWAYRNCWCKQLPPLLICFKNCLDQFLSCISWKKTQGFHLMPCNKILEALDNSCAWLRWWTVLIYCAWCKVVHCLCLNQPFLEEEQCLKAEECALLCREMKMCGLCFMLCIKYTVLGHISHLILMKVCVHLSLWMLDMNDSKMRSLFFFFSPLKPS